jgi:hypothetical protein
MIGFPHELPAVLWHGGKPVPLTVEWITETIESIAKKAGEPNWHWSPDVARATRLYFKTEYEYATITPSELVDIIRQLLEALGRNQMAKHSHLAPPRTEIYLPEIVSRAGMEISFYQNLRERLNEMMDAQVRSVRLNGMRRCSKMLEGTRKWRRSCEGIYEQIELYAIACVRERAEQDIEIIISP